MILYDIIDVINKSSEIIIVTHISPDGDGIGCLTSLYKALKKLNKNVSAFIDDIVPDKYKFLPFTDKIKRPYKKDADLIIVIDCADLNRMGKASTLLKSTPISINIDHHISNNLFAKMNYVDSNAASSAEIIYQIIKLLGVNIDLDIAKSLYTGIVTDTGGFMYSSTTSFTHEVAADLINTGVKVDEISDIIFHSTKFSKLKLLGIALSGIELYGNNRIAYMEIKDQDFNTTDTSIQDVEDIINYGRDINGVEVAVLLVEDNENNKIKGSLRSKKYIDVNKIAQKFGGGGHIRASGFSLKCDLKYAKEKIISELLKEVDN